MTTSIVDTSPLFDLRSSIVVQTGPDALYDIVSDLGRSGEWSPECVGGEWVSGEPGRPGSIFRGENLREPEVVGWAPLIRGTWYTESRVVRAVRGSTFQWMMLSHVGNDQESIWGFDMDPVGFGTRLTHHFRMGKATNGIQHIVADLSEEDRRRFVTDWTAKLEDDLYATLRRIQDVAEDEYPMAG